MEKKVNKVIFVIVGVWLFGVLGVDRFMRGQILFGILKLITAGGFGIWCIIDFVFAIIAICKTKEVGEVMTFVDGKYKE